MYNFKQRSFCALTKWRRFHSRARLDDLRSCLAQINRKDILDEIERHLNATYESKQRKKASMIKIDPKKLEADKLHENLLKFFNKQKKLSEKKAYRVL